MKKPIFTGVATALITPFDKNGKIDYARFADLVEFQIANGINALVVCGTTGEASTLTDDEHKDAISFVVKQTAGRVPVIAGTGSNDTAYAIWLTEHACEVGADAVLLDNGWSEAYCGLSSSKTQFVDFPLAIYQ